MSVAAKPDTIDVKVKVKWAKIHLSSTLCIESFDLSFNFDLKSNNYFIWLDSDFDSSQIRLVDDI